MDVPALLPGEIDYVGSRPPLRALLPEGRRLALVGVCSVALAVASFAVFGASAHAVVGAVLCPTLVLLAVIDLRHRLLPNAIVLPSALLIALLVAAFDAGNFFEHLWAGLALFGFFFVFAAIFRGSLGVGDAKVGLLIGVALGSRTLGAVMIAFFGLFIAAVWILVRHGLTARRRSLPFGPFLAGGAILAFFFT
jgi:leader peptidase (prepilin peptidase) / N-methyltransferase